MKTILVSIIIPTFNRAHLITETLDSVLNQTFTNWECIVVDDGSTDNTYEVVAGYVQKDSRFKYYVRPADRLPGGNAARNYGFEMSNGKFILFYDSDDVMFPEKVKEHFVIFQNNECDASITRSVLYNFKTKEGYLFWREFLFTDDIINDFILLKAGWQTGDVLWKREILYELKFDERLVSSQDWEFHLRMLFSNISFMFRDICLSKIRHTEGSIKNTYNMDKILSDYYSRKSVLSLNKIHKKINKKGYIHILNEYFKFFFIFFYHKKYILASEVFVKIVFLTFITSSYEIFFKEFVVHCLKKVRKCS